MAELFGDLPAVSKKKDKEYEVISEKGQKAKVVFKPVDFVADAEVIGSITKIVNLIEGKDIEIEREVEKK